MKTYLPQIERRILVRPNQTFGILNYDTDNAYPQRMLELVANPPPLKIAGTSGPNLLQVLVLKRQRLANKIVNSNGLTIAKLLKALATDKALFRGFGIHVNYNANFKIHPLTM
jgi:hypothetical protein